MACFSCNRRCCCVSLAGMSRRVPLMLLIDQTVSDNAPVYAALLSQQVQDGATTFLAEWAKVLPPKKMPTTETDAARRFWYRAGLASARALAVAHAGQQGERRRVGPYADTTFDARVQKAVDFISAASCALYVHKAFDQSHIVQSRGQLARADTPAGLRFRHKMLDQASKTPPHLKGIALLELVA